MAFMWSVIVGFVLFLIMKNGWAFLFGFFIGPMLYAKFGNIKKKRVNPVLFLTVLFETLGHMSKAKGVVTQADIHLAYQVMDQLQLDENSRRSAQDSFNRGKSSNYPLRERLRELYAQYGSRRDVLNIFCEQLIQAALVDGTLDDKEQQILFIIAQEFHIPQQQMIMYIQMMVGSYHFQQKESYYSRQRSSYNGYGSNNYGSNNYGSNGYGSNSRSRQNDLQNAYRILGISESVEVVEIKRAYRKLMNEHHPDKLASKGLPKEMLETAKKRAQEIQLAYDLIKVSRGFK